MVTKNFVSVGAVEVGGVGDGVVVAGGAGDVDGCGVDDGGPDDVSGA